MGHRAERVADLSVLETVKIAAGDLASLFLDPTRHSLSGEHRRGNGHVLVVTLALLREGGDAAVNGQHDTGDVTRRG